MEEPKVPVLPGEITFSSIKPILAEVIEFMQASKQQADDIRAKLAQEIDKRPTYELLLATVADKYELQNKRDEEIFISPVIAQRITMDLRNDVQTLINEFHRELEDFREYTVEFKQNIRKELWGVYESIRKFETRQQVAIDHTNRLSEFTVRRHQKTKLVECWKEYARN